MGTKGAAMDRDALEQSIISTEPAARVRAHSDRASVEIAPQRLLDFMRRMRDDRAFAFDLLLDHTAVDQLETGCFELVYTLYSLEHGHYLAVFSSISRENPVVPSVSSIWQAAHWQEREVFDLFGIRYDDHDDLRRIFLEDSWQGHPLRKDYKDDDMLELS